MKLREPKWKSDIYKKQKEAKSYLDYLDESNYPYHLKQAGKREFKNNYYG